jgi:pimeloyl-ACP methyl ester carboxylesterase
MEATTGYVRLGEDRIAYQVVGGGPIDLVITPGSFLSFDVAGEDPVADLYFRRLASFTRLIRFDRRGAGASDPVALDALPHLESYVEETVAVMDAVGSHQPAIMACTEPRRRPPVPRLVRQAATFDDQPNGGWGLPAGDVRR